MIKAEIIADSINTAGERITTMKLTFPRIILAEFNTHRVFSRNSASSRAIPFNKMVESVETNPFIPIAWQKDHKGMQGTEYITDLEIIEECRRAWLAGRDDMIELAANMNANQEVTKQLCNRLLEPFMWHTIICTATDWENFFKQRCPKYKLFYEQIPMVFRSKKDLLEVVRSVELPEFVKDYDNMSEIDWLKYNQGQAEIHMMTLAEAMWDALNESVPVKLLDGEWHIPFYTPIDDVAIKNLMVNLGYSSMEVMDDLKYSRNYTSIAIGIATARCARVSYTTVGENKQHSYEDDIKLHDRLIRDLHRTPTEHCAQASPGTISRNFKGFKQYREIVESV